MGNNPAQAFVFDFETMGNGHPDYRGVWPRNRVVWSAFSTQGQTFVVPTGHPNGDRMVEKPRRRKDPLTKKFGTTPARWEDPPEQMSPALVFDIVKPLFFDTSLTKVGSGIKFDILTSLKYYDQQLMPGPYDDTIVQSWLLDENSLNGLKEITKSRYKRVYDAEHVGRKIEIHPFWKVAQYAFMDAKFTWLNSVHQLRELRREGLMDLYEFEMQDVFNVVLNMEKDGMPVDREAMEALEPVLVKRREEAEADFYRSAGRKVNLNSPKQKVDVLYGDKADGGQGLRPWKLTKGGYKKVKDAKKANREPELTLYDYSTDKESLEKFEGKNKVVDNLLRFQEVDRVLGTYVHGYLGFEHPTDPKKSHPTIIFDGKVHPDFVQYGTVTGRFSCRDPNLQNIPRPDTELGKQIRSLFVAGDGHRLVVADYGQIELVVLAHFVGKGALYRGFFEGIDPHTMTAALVFNKDPQELQALVDAEDPEAKGYRQAAKAINFAVVYGAGPDKVASMAKVSLRRAKEILATHERQFPEIYKFKDKALRTCRSRKPPHLTTILGRKRRLPSIMSSDWGTAGKAERQAINSLIQGTAADVIKTAMVRLHEGLAQSDTGGRLLLTVHDELVTRCPAASAEDCADVVREAMVGDGIQKMLDVPLSIDLKVVNKWSEAK